MVQKYKNHWYGLSSVLIMMLKYTCISIVCVCECVCVFACVECGGGYR